MKYVSLLTVLFTSAYNGHEKINTRNSIAGTFAYVKYIVLCGYVFCDEVLLALPFTVEVKAIKEDLVRSESL